MTAVAPEGYPAETIEHGWSRNVMWHHISTRLQQRNGQAINSRVTWRMGCPSRLRPSFRTKNEPVAFA